MKWYHSFPYAVGKNPLRFQEEIVAALIPGDLSGKTVLDLAAWDGYFSWVASKRGAEVVVAVDNGLAEARDFAEQNPEWWKCRFLNLLELRYGPAELDQGFTGVV